MSQQNESTPATAPVTVYVTTFGSLYGAAKHAGPVPWDDLYARWRDRESLPTDTSKDSQPLISPAEFDGKRAIGNAVVRVHMQAVEFDNCEKLRVDGKTTAAPLPPERRCTFEQAVAFVRKQQWDGIVVTSYSHQPDHHKFRLYLRTSRPVTPDEHRRLQRWLHRLFDEAGMLPDPVTVNPDRRWFVPIKREGHEYKVKRVDGTAIDVDAILSTLPEEPAPAPNRKNQIATRLDEYIEKLADSIDMIDLLEDEGEKLERRGHYARLWRPFADDGKRPGCVAYADHYFDHGRREYVDAITYVQKKRALDFWGALDWLADRAGVPMLDRTKARRSARIDPTGAFERLPTALPEVGREDLLAEVAAAIATLDDADRPAWIARVIDRYRHDVHLAPADPTPLFDALPATIEPKDAEGLVAQVVSAIATLTPTEQSAWIGRLAQRWKEGRRNVLDRERLVQLVRDSRRAQVAALRSSTTSEVNRVDLERLVQQHAKRLDRRAVECDTTSAYKVIDGCLHLVRTDADGAENAKRLLNGDLAIVGCTARDDGLQTSDVFLIRATLSDGRTIHGIEVPTDRFDACDWITPATAGALRVEPSVRDARRYIAHAVLSRSRFERTRSFTSFGWHEINRKPIFVHAGGAIGTSEPIDVRVPHPKLAAFTLSEVGPDPAEAAAHGHDRARQIAIGRGIAGTLKLLTILPQKYAFPLFASAVSAPVMQALAVRVPFLILGITGCKKSSIAREFQRMYGRFICDADFALNFESTSTATSYLGFVPQDLLAVADDAYPKGTSTEAERQRSHVRSLIHNYVNGQTRERGTKDGGLASSRPIRCLLWLTAEMDLIPPQVAESTAYRTLKIRLQPGDVNEAALTDVQATPDLTVTTRAYVEHLAADPSWREAMPVRCAAVVAQLRAQRAVLGLQDRQPEIIASLLVAFEHWIRWAAGYVAFDEVRIAKMLSMAKKALVTVAVEQTADARSTNPASSFVDTLRALLTSGRCQVVPRTDRLNGAAAAPEIGWYDDQEVIFEIQSTYREVRRAVDHDLLAWPDLYGRLVQAKLCRPPTVDEKTNVVRKGTRVRAGGGRDYHLVFTREVFAGVPLAADDIDAETKRDQRDRYDRLSAESDEIAQHVLSPGGDA